MKKFICLALLLVAVHADSYTDTFDNIDEYTEELTSGYSVSHKYNSTAGEISITLEVEQDGWIGFGFGSGMSDADCYYYNAGGSGELVDAKCSGYSAPTTDSTDDLTLVSEDVSGGMTTITFTRAMDTGDDDDTALSEGSNSVMYAWGSSTTLGQHSSTARGVGSMTIMADYNQEYYETFGDIDSTDVELDTDYSVSYKYNSTAMEISFTVSVETDSGWIGFGIGDGMSDADCYYFNADGDGELVDGKCSGYTAPSTDASNDLTLISSSVGSGTTTFTFTRAMDTDDDDDTVLMEGDNDVMYAWGGALALSQHETSSRGVGTLTIADSSSSSSSSSSDDDDSASVLATSIATFFALIFNYLF